MNAWNRWSTDKDSNAHCTLLQRNEMCDIGGFVAKCVLVVYVFFVFVLCSARSFSFWMPWKIFRPELKFKYLRMVMCKQCTVHTHTRAHTHKCSGSFLISLPGDRVTRRFFMVIFGIHFTAIHTNHGNSNRTDDAKLKKNHQTEANIVCIRLHMVKWFGLAICCNEKRSPQICWHSQCPFHIYSRFA